MSWNDDYADYDDIRLRRPARRPQGREGESGVGIISLVTSLIAGVIIAVVLISAVIMSTDPNGPPPDNDPKMVLVGLGFLASLGAALIGLVLGIVGCIQPHRGMLCAILGTVFNGFLLLGVLGLVCAGLMMG